MTQGYVPSGTVLPRWLRRRTGALDEHDTSTTSDSLTSETLGALIHQGQSALKDIQSQIARGEESYYEETNNHGNIYKGWEIFVDSRDAFGNGNGSQSFHPGSRRVPADCRWFSTSCQSSDQRVPTLSEQLKQEEKEAALKLDSMMVESSTATGESTSRNNPAQVSQNNSATSQPATGNDTSSSRLEQTQKNPSNVSGPEQGDDTQGDDKQRRATRKRKAAS